MTFRRDQGGGFLIRRPAFVLLLSRTDDRIPRRDNVRCHAGL